MPDDNFEQHLIDQGFDSGPLDNYVPTANINTRFVLDVNNLGIDNLTGVEDFTALTYLDCSENYLTSLDVSNNTALDALVCNNNSLTDLDVTNNPLLTELYCGMNNLGLLDVSNNPLLTHLYCEGTGLSSLDISNNNVVILNSNINLDAQRQ